MKAVVGVVLIVVGVCSIAFRARMARANAASNKVMTGGRFGGPGMIAYGTVMNALVGVVFVIAGIVLISWQLGA